MTQNAYGDEHDPYLRLIEAIFNGGYGKYPLSREERIKWMEKNLPMTFTLVSAGAHWPILTDLQESVR